MEHFVLIPCPVSTLGHLKDEMNEDPQLLAEFCRSASDAAFAELVNRHVKLVYSTSLRLVNGDTHQAQDIAQIVFSNLARKARNLAADPLRPSSRLECIVSSRFEDLDSCSPGLSAFRGGPTWTHLPLNFFHGLGGKIV
jgi:hypothetical protein